ncbi:MAG: NUDIX domain-containing protein [Micromonosporaceae bacterium]|nr:NUDIX domain-containing protein [Micromonosporaceae bacterium]
MPAVCQRSARALVVDDVGRLLLIRRTRPGLMPYWTTPGGRVEPGDGSVYAAMVREVREELGAEVDRIQQVFLATDRVDGTGGTAGAGGGAVGLRVQHFFVCRLVSMDLSLRSGPEFVDLDGSYDVERVVPTADGKIPVDLRPRELKAFVEANWVALLDAAGYSGGCAAGEV